MGGQETNHSSFVEVVGETSSYITFATPTIQNYFGSGIMSIRRKMKGVLLNNFKLGVDRKATHLWNK